MDEPKGRGPATHAETLGQDGCLYQALEFDGEYAKAIDMDGRFTLTNIAIEVGAKSAAFAIDETTQDYRSAGWSARLRRSGPISTRSSHARSQLRSTHVSRSSRFLEAQTAPFR